MAKKKKRPELKSITIRYYCPVDDKTKSRTYKYEELWFGAVFSFDSADCELCGSHSHLGVDISCDCGKMHSIEIYSD